jgi:hypothetical protein
MLIPFLELPVPMLNEKKEQVILKLKINPLAITGYLEQPNNRTIIYTQGASFLIDLSISEYEKTIQIFFNTQNNKPKIHKFN